MVRALFAVAVLALSVTAVVAAWEPLEADSLFARSPDVSFEPLENAPSPSRRDGAAHAPKYFPRTHQAVARSFNAFHATSLSKELTSINDVVKSSHAGIMNTCASAHKTSPDQIITSIHTHLQPCKETIHKGCGSIPHIPWKPHPSSYPHPGGGSPPSCSGILAELIELLEEIFMELEKVAKEIPSLSSTIKGYLESIDAELAELVHSSNIALPQVEDWVKKFTKNIQPQLETAGFWKLLDLLKA